MKRAKEAVADGKSVVIGLQSTGESHTRKEVNRYSAEQEEEKRDGGGGGGNDNRNSNNSEIDDGRNRTAMMVGASTELLTILTFISSLCYRFCRLILLELHIVEGFISSPKAVLLQLLNKGFPSIVIPEYLMHVTARDEDEIDEITAADGSRKLMGNT